MALLALASASGAACGRCGYDPTQAHASDTGPLPDGDADGTDGSPQDAGDGLDGATDTPDAAPLSNDYCAEIPPLPERPVIDGVLDPGVRLLPLVPEAWTEPEPIPDGHSTEYAVAWRPDGLYVYVAVADPSRLPAPTQDYAWCGDAVEVFADADGSYPNAPDYDDPGTRQFVLVAPADADTPEQRGEGYCRGCGGSSPQDISGTASFIAVPRPDGYALEMFVAASDLGLPEWSLTGGAQVGFDMAIDVSEDAPTSESCDFGSSGDGMRLGQYFLRVADSDPVHPFRNVEAFCTASLIE